ncbi:MAG: hypothetical protein ACREV6_14840 [Clostridium sp.]|uniref:hypothetical protein n=1 Tax=Clostridium sp. TaxID=1506 RepID=UPI003D6D20A7
MKLLWYTDNVFFKEKTISITGMQYACLSDLKVLAGIPEYVQAIEKLKVAISIM